MKNIDSVSRRRFSSSEYDYIDPENLLKQHGFLPTIDSIQQGTLKGHQRKAIAEKYQAALLAYILGQNKHSNLIISFCIKEEDDFDCVFKMIEPSGKIVYRPVQLKEYSNRDPNEPEFQIEINKLKNKNYLSDLSVAFWINRNVTIELNKLDFSGLKIQQLWLMGETPLGEVILRGGLLRHLILGSIIVRILKNGKVHTSIQSFRPCKPIGDV